MITLHHGDCLDVLPALAPRSVQTIVTSPPYFGLRDYQIAPSAWPAITYQPLAGVEPVTVPAWSGCLGAEPDLLLYTAHLVHVFRLARETLRRDGTLWLNLGDSYATNPGNGRGGEGGGLTKGGATPHRSGVDKTSAGVRSKNLLGVPWRVAQALQADGWYLRADVIWHKPNAMPSSVTDRPTSSHEYLFLLARSARYYYDAAAIAEPVAQSSLDRIGQSTFDEQTGGAKDYANGVNPSRSARKAVENFAANTTGTRNIRSVWTIATQPYAGAHYATMPELLVERCIRAGSSAQTCEHCGAAWGRVVEATGEIQDRWSATNNYAEINRTQPERTTRRVMSTTGFVATCTCADNTGTGRSVVLDPFCGTGTVCQVAERLCRDSIGIDLAYQDLQQERTRALQTDMTGLF